MTNNDEVTAIITVDDFPSRPELITLLRDYMKQNGNNSSYSCANRSNSLSITFHDSDVAYGFLKVLNATKMKNDLYKNTQFTLSFKSKMNHSSSALLKKSYNKSHLNTSKSSSRLTISKKINYLANSYEHSHWRDINAKAGIISGDSPYLPDEKYVHQQFQENKKKWINKQNFNVFVGRATSNRNYIIKNYVQMTPSIPPVLHSFRPVNKDKWISKKGFMVI